MAKEKALECLLMRMGLYTKENGKRIKGMEKGSYKDKMDHWSMMVHGIWTAFMDMVYCTIKNLSNSFNHMTIKIYHKSHHYGRTIKDNS